MANKLPRPTTRAGRRGLEPRDQGTDELQRLRLAATGHADLPTDPLGVLLGRGFIDKTQYAAGRDLGELLELARRRLGLPDAGCHVSWLAILAGGHTAANGRADIGSGEWARRALLKIEQEIADPQMADLVFAVAEGVWLRWLAVALAGGRAPRAVKRLCTGLDRVARSWAPAKAS
jgi:hypothetical protein